jgi:predicted small secreted protein
MKTILLATLLALSATSVAAQNTFYGPGGDYLGQGTRHRNTTTYYDARGSFVGSSLSIGRSTSFFGRDGAFQGTLSRTGDTTNFYDRAGRYQGSVITLPSPLGDKRWPRR